MNQHTPADKANQPLGLTECEAKGIAAVIEHGTYEVAAKALAISVRALKANMAKARARTGISNNIQLAIKFDRERSRLRRCKPTPPVRSTEPAWPLPPNSVFSWAQQ